MPPINCFSKSRSFSSDLFNVAMNSQDKANQEPSATSLAQQLLKLIISATALFRRVPVLPQEPSQRCKSSRSWPHTWEPKEGRRGVLAAVASCAIFSLLPPPTQLQSGKKKGQGHLWLSCLLRRRSVLDRKMWKIFAQGGSFTSHQAPQYQTNNNYVWNPSSTGKKSYTLQDEQDFA